MSETTPAFTTQAIPVLKPEEFMTAIGSKSVASETLADKFGTAIITPVEIPPPIFDYLITGTIVFSESVDPNKVRGTHDLKPGVVKHFDSMLTLDHSITILDLITFKEAKKQEHKCKQIILQGFFKID